MEHTKGPWRAVKLGGSYYLCNSNSDSIEFIELSHGGIGKANVRRIVACVNALAHVSNEELESGTLQNFVIKLREVEIQRDELQADNKRLREEVEYWNTLHAQDVNTLKEELREAEKAQDFCFACGKDLNGT